MVSYDDTVVIMKLLLSATTIGYEGKPFISLEAVIGMVQALSYPGSEITKADGGYSVKNCATSMKDVSRREDSFTDNGFFNMEKF